VSYRRRRTDANHAPIAQALTQLGHTVLDLSAVGGGCADLLVRFRDGAMLFVEVKTPAGLAGRSGNPATRAKQAAFRAKWPTVVVTTIEEVAKL
jgi:Holliday junction resolvase-like predicted endonuclease